MKRGFSTEVCIQEAPGKLKNLPGNVEVLAPSLGVSHLLGKEYCAAVTRKRPVGSGHCA